MQKIFLAALSFSLGLGLLTAGSALAHGAHEHGVAHMNINIEADGLVEIELESPLASFLSFEHAPSTEEQRAEVQAMAAIFNDPAALFVFPAAAQCQPVEISLESEVLAPALLSSGGLSLAAKEHGDHDDDAEHDHEADHDHDDAEHDHDDDEADHEHGHADLDAEFSFRCQNTAQLNSLEVQLFKAFPSLQEVEVQLLSPKGQAAAELDPTNLKLTW